MSPVSNLPIEATIELSKGPSPKERAEHRNAERAIKQQLHILKKKLKPLKKKDLIILIMDNASRANHFQAIAADLHEKNLELQKAIESKGKKKKKK